MGEIKWTSAQRTAVKMRGGNLLVAAAAGSGKTMVLVDRLMGYICDPQSPANVDDFLIITYTRPAAAELRGKIAARLSQLLAENPGSLHLQRQLQRIYLAKISTVHAFCRDVLQEYAFPLDLPGDFRVLDETEANDLRNSAMETVLEEAYRQADREPEIYAFLETQGLGRDDRGAMEILAQVYANARCHLRPAEWLSKSTQLSEAGKDSMGVEETPWGAYLLRCFRSFLNQAEVGLTVAASWAEEDNILCQKYLPVLQENLKAIQRFLACGTWDQMASCCIADFGRLGAVRKASDPERCERIKAVRKDIWEELKGWQEILAQSSAENQEQLRRLQPALVGLRTLVERFSERYELEKQRRRALDFSDLEHKMLELLLGRNLTGPTRAAHEISGRFREVMVDEYQDTNQVQDEIFSVLTSTAGNCFMVGDVKQSIYRFRLADPSIFLEKYNRFEPAESTACGDGRKILLSDNFRSGNGILQAANDVFRLCMCPAVGGLYYDDESALREGMPHIPLPDSEVELCCIELDSIEDDKGRQISKPEIEAAFVARQIASLLQSGARVRSGDGLRPVRPSDIVILLRSPGSVAGYYLQALQRVGVNASAGSGENILLTTEISVLRALLQVLDNPRQDIPLVTLLASPVCGFTAEQLARIRIVNHKGCLYDAMLTAAETDPAVKRFTETLASLRARAQMLPLTSLVETAMEQLHMEAVFRTMQDGQMRIRNLRIFFRMAVDYAAIPGRDLSQFLKFLEQQEAMGMMPDAERAADAVTIMSIHKSKGLEFPVVFLANLSASFNREDLRAGVLTDPELGIGCYGMDPEARIRYPTLPRRAISEKIRREAVAEELRVLYVAMTRAKDRLIMTYASKYLRKELERLSLGLEMGQPERLSAQAGCLGHWVMMAAMCRTESGQLFSLANPPTNLTVSDVPWRVRVCSGSDIWMDWTTSVKSSGSESTYQELLQMSIPPMLEHALNFSYPYAAACGAPSKITATQIKGRELDREVLEQAQEQEKRASLPWRVPAFAAEEEISGRERGTATHMAMQFARYEACRTEGDLNEELDRLVREEFLTPRQAKAVNCDQMLCFFQTELGRRLASGAPVLREFKFSLLENGEKWNPSLTGEKILVQGVVDCCLKEPDGLVVLDFKTDRIRKGEEQAAAEKYTGQICTYAAALEKIFRKHVKRGLLYFFHTGSYVEVPLKIN